MEELSMLVTLTCGESEVTSRLRAGGWRTAVDLARADVDELCTESGLSAAAAQRLIRAAKDHLAESGGAETKAPRNALRGLPSEQSAPPTDSKASRKSPRTTGSEGDEGRGVSPAESSALSGAAPGDDRVSGSFWRFG